VELLTSAARRAARAGTLLAMAALAACGGSDGTGPDGGGSGRISASLDGRAWTSNTAAGMEVAAHSAPGLYVVQGGQLDGSVSTTIVITLYNIRGAGTYPLGVNATTVGGSAILVEGGRGWGTPLSGDAGTITITELTATKMVATFSFNADALSGGATGSRSVTGGHIDMPVQMLGTVGPLPDNAGSRVAASINGTQWNAATIAGGVISSGALIFSTSNTTRTIGFSLAGVSAVGTYPLTSTRVIQVTGTTTPATSWGLAAGSTGSVTVTTLTATRIAGTFNASLAPSPGTTGTLTITNGTFDLGRL
jgi:hypothetical protein